MPEFGRERRAKRFTHSLELPGRQAVVEREDMRHVDRYHFRVSLLDLTLEHLPLLVAPELGLCLDLSASRTRRWLGRPNRLIHAAL